MPTTLATSSAAPPPKPITLSARCALNAAAPAITWPQVGLPNTPSNTATSSPARWLRNSASTGSAPSARSVTISGRLQPASSRCCATSRRAPAPKWMGVGKEKRVMVMGAAGGSESSSAVVAREAAKPGCARTQRSSIVSFGHCTTAPSSASPRSACGGTAACSGRSSSSMRSATPTIARGASGRARCGSRRSARRAWGCCSGRR